MNRSIWAWVRVLGGVGILAVLLWRLGTGAFVDGLRVIDGPTLVAAFAIGVTTTVFSAWRWCLVARGLGLKLSLRGAIADYYKALFINAALPAGATTWRATYAGDTTNPAATSAEITVMPPRCSVPTQTLPRPSTARESSSWLPGNPASSSPWGAISPVPVATPGSGTFHSQTRPVYVSAT